MSDSVQIVTLILGFLTTTITAVIGYLVLRLNKQQTATSEVVKEVVMQTKNTQADVRKIELATNSMKDALVAATGEAAHATGELKGRADKAAEIKADAKADADVAATVAKQRL